MRYVKAYLASRLLSRLKLLIDRSIIGVDKDSSVKTDERLAAVVQGECSLRKMLL
jgi:hypothetical protein